jgi:hypothetical protein
MRTHHLLADVESEVQLDVSSDTLDLSKWIFEMSDLDYQNCAKKHWAMGVSVLPDGRRVCTNVETVGGHLMVQHYVETVSESDHVELVSEKSDLYVFHLIHTHARVTWEMKLIPRSDSACVFRCRARAEHRSRLLGFVSRLVFVPRMVQKHDDEETPKFADDLLRKFKHGQ